MRIGDFARRSGLSRDTIRFYERNGLIQSSLGTEATNSYREYDEDLLERIAMIREAQAAGMSISDLAVFIQQLENTADYDFDAEAFLDLKIIEIENRIARSRKFLETLRLTRTALSPRRQLSPPTGRKNQPSSTDVIS